MLGRQHQWRTGTGHNCVDECAATKLHCVPVSVTFTIFHVNTFSNTNPNTITITHTNAHIISDTNLIIVTNSDFITNSQSNSHVHILYFHHTHCVGVLVSCDDTVAVS